MKFVKKPIITEATQWFKLGDHKAVTPYSKISYGYLAEESGGRVIRPGDYIITEPNGEYSLCCQKAFEQRYEKYTETESINDCLRRLLDKLEKD